MDKHEWLIVDYGESDQVHDDQLKLMLFSDKDDDWVCLSKVSNDQWQTNDGRIGIIYIFSQL